MEEEKKKSWGGARIGAGRKKMEHGKVYAFRSSVEVDALLSSYDGNRNALINEAVSEWFKSHR